VPYVPGPVIQDMGPPGPPAPPERKDRLVRVKAFAQYAVGALQNSRQGSSQLAWQFIAALLVIVYCGSLFTLQRPPAATSGSGTAA
jgi:hypothetical protein